jgi:digeranylgeranylglycerophospholipid reductase
MRKRYDLVVVGGGPAGSWTAKRAAEQGLSVLLLEKDRTIGTPVRCAEGVSEKGLQKVIEVRERWISQIIQRIHLVAPDGAVVEVSSEGVGFVLERKIFDFDLAKMASEAGVRVLTKAYVKGLMIEEDSVRGVEVFHMGRTSRVESQIVVGADGVESRVGRWGGLRTDIPPEEMASCIQMRISGIDIDPEVAQFYFSQEIAPGGYLWIFPKGEREANVGLGISVNQAKGKRAYDYLISFIESHFPDASVLRTVAGGVPLVPTLKRITSHGLMLVGDAARQANPLSGGGILNGMIAGKIAADVAVEAIRKGDVSNNRLSSYQRLWMKEGGKANERCYKIKKVVTGFSDTDINRLAQLLLKVPESKRTLFQIMKAALVQHPKLILDAAKVFADPSR